MDFSNQEKSLLKKLKKGLFDGQVGDDLVTSGGSIIWTVIENGIPVRKKQGPGGKFFNGKENTRYSGKLHILEKYDTDEKKIGFMRKFGWLIEDKDVRQYSAKYKPKKGGE